MQEKKVIKNTKELGNWLSKLYSANIIVPVNVEISILLDDKEFKEIAKIHLPVNKKHYEAGYSLLYKSNFGYTVNLINEDKLLRSRQFPGATNKPPKGAKRS